MFQAFIKCKWDQVEKLLYLRLSATPVPSFHQVMFSSKVGCKEILTTYKLKEVKRASHFATTTCHAHCTYSEHSEHPHATFLPSSISQSIDPPHPLLESQEHCSSLQPLFGKLRAINMTATRLVFNQAGQFYCYLNDCKRHNCIFQFCE